MHYTIEWERKGGFSHCMGITFPIGKMRILHERYIKA